MLVLWIRPGKGGDCGVLFALVVIDQFRNIKIQTKTVDLSTRLWGIRPTKSAVIPQSLVVRSTVLGRILIYQNWPTSFK